MKQNDKNVPYTFADDHLTDSEVEKLKTFTREEMLAVKKEIEETGTLNAPRFPPVVKTHDMQIQSITEKKRKRKQ